MSWLLNVNFLLASRWTTHADHTAVRAWLDKQAEFRTTPIVELGFMRVSLSPPRGVRQTAGSAIQHAPDHDSRAARRVSNFPLGRIENGGWRMQSAGVRFANIHMHATRT